MAARKRGNNEGSISHYGDGRWVARVTLPDGRRRAFYAATRQDAAHKLAEVLHGVTRGTVEPAGRLTFGDFAATWLKASRASVRLTTWAGYERYLRIHVVPRIGRVPMARIGAADLQQLYADLLDDGLKPMSVRHVHAILHRVLGQAVRWDAAVRNVADLVDPPRVIRTEMSVLSPEEARRFLAAAAGDRLEALYVLAVTTGMRRGELLALRWKDVHLDRAKLSVVATQQREGGLAIAETKTARSRRSISLPGITVAALRRRRMLQAEERLAAKPGEWEESGVVFTTAVGSLIEPGNLLRRSFFPLLARAGVPRIRFHDLRHTAATLMLSEGIHPKVASEILGHSTVSITLDLYSHVTESVASEAAQRMDRLLTPDPA
ncbi:MAG: site-specific integrase [Candidatus Dormibacteria bacterium]